jgi:uncharacterized repeat protein (TIGR02543 family)
MKMANTVDKVLKIAEAEVGYLEKSKAAYQKDSKILYEKTKGAGSDNYTKYGKEMHDLYPSVMDFPAYWCDCFTDYCFYKAYGVTNAKKLLGGNFDDYTVASAQLYKNKNAYYKSNPKVGDQIFFNNGTRICHTGLVYKVDSNYVYTIEGNTSGANGVVSNGGGVAKKKYALNYNRIDGYGRPKYDVEETKTKSYKITYKLNGGTNAANPSSYDGSATIALKNPTRSGYSFKGWYKDADFTEKVTEIKKGTKGDVTLYAKWKKSVSATVKTNGATLTMRNKDANIMQYLPNGAKVTDVTKDAMNMKISGKTYTMAKCTYGGKTGYVAQSYLKF